MDKVRMTTEKLQDVGGIEPSGQMKLENLLEQGGVH